MQFLLFLLTKTPSSCTIQGVRYRVVGFLLISFRTSFGCGQAVRQWSLEHLCFLQRLLLREYSGYLLICSDDTKLPAVRIFLFWADGQKRGQFFELPGDPRAGLLCISHIVMSDSVAVSAQNDTLTDFFLNPIQAKPVTDCISNVKHLVLRVYMVKL